MHSCLTMQRGTAEICRVAIQSVVYARLVLDTDCSTNFDLGTVPNTICGLQALVVNSTVATLHVFLFPYRCIAVCPSQVMYMPYETMSQ